MKILREKYLQVRQNRSGFATIIFISLLAIMVLLAAANTAALIHLHREVKLLEQTQVKRLQSHPVPVPDKVTNSNTK